CLTGLMSLRPYLQCFVPDEALDVKSAPPRNVQFQCARSSYELSFVLSISCWLSPTKDLLKVRVGNENRRCSVVQEKTYVRILSFEPAQVSVAKPKESPTSRVYLRIAKIDESRAGSHAKQGLAPL